MGKKQVQQHPLHPLPMTTTASVTVMRSLLQARLHLHLRQKSESPKAPLLQEQKLSKRARKARAPRLRLHLETAMATCSAVAMKRAAEIRLQPLQLLKTLIPLAVPLVVVVECSMIFLQVVQLY